MYKLKTIDFLIVAIFDAFARGSKGIEIKETQIYFQEWPKYSK